MAELAGQDHNPRRINLTAKKPQRGRRHPPPAPLAPAAEAETQILRFPQSARLSREVCGIEGAAAALAAPRLGFLENIAVELSKALEKCVIGM